ncbi:twin-arginine translocation signal domain-containing protein [Candidatus Nanosalina sp. VS9-1]|uniref:twin-arginine translocation signal domain-containing protein n=1 Tax=Candidatus Nanosalina sp. VS9-1 TaxID=3388566 RepID=UPI0039E0EB86
MNLSRRELLKTTGAMLAAGATATSNPRPEGASAGFEELRESVEDRRSFREENAGATIYLGSADTLDKSVSGGSVYDNTDFNDVERMLEEGKRPEEVVSSDSSELHHSGGDSAQVVRERSEEVKLVYMSEDGERPLESYAESLQQAFRQLDPSVDIDVTVETVQPDQEDVESLEDVSSGEFEGLKADLDLKNKYSGRGQEPVFLVESDILPDAGGVSDYMTGVAFVELTEDEAWNRHVVNHETGHSLLGLPHHFHEDGAMSYNPEANRDESFHPRSRMMAKALLTGQTDYNVRDRTVTGIFDGEQKEKRYKQIDIMHNSRDLGTEAVTQDFFHHLETYVEQVLGYDMSSWEPERHEIVEEDDGVYDIAVYSHRDGSEMQLKVDSYIEEMKLEN